MEEDDKQNFYNDYQDENFGENLNKYEFWSNSTDKKKNYLYHEPSQLLLRNFISKNTIYEDVLLYHNLGVGKCHAKDTPIIMFDGSIKMVQDIVIGDKLMGDDSTSRTVLSLASGKDTMYKIIPEYGEDSFIVNKEHILCLKVDNYPKLSKKIFDDYKVEWIEDNVFYEKSFRKKNDAQKFLNIVNDYNNCEILEISVSDYLTLPKQLRSRLKGYKSGIKFPNKETPMDPYIVGYWLGRYLNSENNLSKTFCKRSKTNMRRNLKFHIIDEIFHRNLKNLDLFNEKYIPDIYKYNSIEKRKILLNGLLDYLQIYINKFTIKYNANMERLMSDIIYLVRSIGYNCYKNGNNLHIDKTNDLTYKFRVKQLNDDQYYGFTLDNNCRYLIGDFTVTHNTCTSISIAEGFKEWINNMGKKIFVLVKNKNIQKNFINEILSKCTNDEYIGKDEDVNKISRHINKYYQFMTYGTFTNRVLGIKQFELDEYGYKTNKVKRENGKIIRKPGKDSLSDMNNTVIIIDEVHNITNNDIYIALKQILSKSYNYRLVLLTATPIADNSKEIFEICNLLNIKDSKILPIRNKLLKETDDGKYYVTKTNPVYINNQILKGGIINVTEWGLERLSKLMYGKVSYLPANKFAFPQRNDIGDDLIPARVGTSQVVYCEMSDYQYSVYLDALEIDVRDDSNFDLTYTVSLIESHENIKENNVVMSQSSALYKNSSDASTMVYPNGLFGKNGFLENFKKGTGNNWEPRDKSILIGKNLEQYSSKLFSLLNNIESSPGNIFVYSNYVSYGGTSLIKQILLANGWKEFINVNKYSENKSFVIFEDNFNIEKRERLRKMFNSSENKYGKYIKLLIGSPVISEGITLKNVRQIHLLEPSWNMTRINQIIGRGIRNRSHEDLLPSERSVDVFKYVSIKTTNLDDNRKGLANFFIDREKYILSEEKDRANKVVERLLKTISFDCELTSNRRILDMDGKADCDYTKCDFTCLIKPKNNVSTTEEKTDKSTYNINITSFDKFDLHWVINKIRDLFHEYFIWNLDDLVYMIRSDNNANISDEIIWTALGHIIDNKILLHDMYEREGFLINRGNYYIFNPLDVDINSSIFTKMLDFSVDKNMYTLPQFMIKSNKFKKEDIIKKEEEKKTQEERLTEDDINYNNNIIQNNIIYGTFRKRGTIENPYGPTDSKFRIVDRRETADELQDMRKSKSGMWIESYFKNDLIEIANWFNIKDELPLEDLDKKQLSDKIQKHMIDNNLVLK